MSTGSQVKDGALNNRRYLPSLKIISNLFLSTNPSQDVQKLLFIATLFAGFFLFAANYRTEPGGYLFVMYAEALAHGLQYLNVHVVQRDIGYPLLLWLSGYPYHHSLIGMAILNTIMAILMPVLIYLTVKPVLPKGSFYIALVSIISLVPFFYIKWIHHDHPYLFFNLLSICCLSLFIDTKRTIYLFAMTAAVIFASLIRPAGNVMFPLFIFLAFLFGRGALLKYILCILFSVCVLLAYNHHRDKFFSQYGTLATSVGEQAFQNLYVNSKEFGIDLSQKPGPVLQKITDNLYRTLLPNPITSSLNRPEDIPHAAFLKSYFLPYTATEFIKQIYQTPCIEYLRMLAHATQSDAVFLKASVEIMQQHPWYPFAFILRNMWHLLYKPGYAHSRYNINPYSRTGLQDAFPFNHESGELIHLSPRALRELNFDVFAHKSPILRKAISFLWLIFKASYLIACKITFYLIALLWLAVILDYLSRWFSIESLQQKIRLLLPKKMRNLTIAITLYLLQSMFVLSLFVDPLFRFHNHLIPFKIILAGFGVAILIQALKLTTFQTFKPITSTTATLKTDEFLQAHKAAPYPLLLLILALLVVWSMFIFAHT